MYQLYSQKVLLYNYERSLIHSVIFCLREGWVKGGGMGCFLKFEPTWFVKVTRLCIPFTHTLRTIVFYIMSSWGSILDYAVNTCGKRQTCLLLFASCLESSKFQVTTHTRQTHAYSGCPSMSSSNTVFPSVRSQGHNCPSHGLFRSDAPSAHRALDQVVYKT